MIIKDNEETGYIKSLFGANEGTPIDQENESVPNRWQEIATSDQHRQEFVNRYKYVRDKHSHGNLRQAIIEHLWAMKGDQLDDDVDC